MFAGPIILHFDPGSWPERDEPPSFPRGGHAATFEFDGKELEQEGEDK
jgi:hypothetical protein